MSCSYEDGCRCRQCFGLAEYMLACSGQDFGLRHAPGHAPGHEARLRVVTPDPNPQGVTFDGAIPFERPCDGSMTCKCKKCEAELAARVAKARGTPDQPWQPRKRRLAEAA